MVGKITKSLHDEVLERLPEGNLEEYVEVDGVIVQETEKAVLVAVGEFGTKEYWLPKRQVAKMDDGCYRRFLVAKWLVMRKRMRTS